MHIKGQEVDWTTIPELIAEKARSHGDALFAEIDGRSIKYRELDELSGRLAAGLAREGVGHGDRVASMLFNCVEQILLWFATNRLGAIWTPLNAGLRGQDLSYSLSDCGTRLLFVDAETSESLAAIDPAIREELEIFFVGGDAGELRAYGELMEAGSELPEVEIAPHDVAMIIYTGGTTGLPKGVMLPHFSFICAGVRYGETFDVSSADVHFTTLPLFHSGAIQFAVMGPLINDMRSVIDRRFSASDYWQRVRQTKATVIDPIGTMVTLLCQQPESATDREHSVRIAIGITGQVPEAVPGTFKRRFGIPLVDMYGLTEAGGAMITTNRLHDYTPGANGKTHGWAEIRIVDQDDEPVQTGSIGEIVLRPVIASMFMIGYHNNDGRTLECFRNLWLHTDDLGYMDESGNLYFVGRQVHWLRRRGENISAYEIESILSGYPGINEVIVVGVPAELGEEDIKACIVAESGAEIDPKALVEWALEHMAAFKVPRFIAFVDEFPRSTAKREVERAKVKAWSNEGVWDREKVMGRISGQSGRRQA